MNRVYEQGAVGAGKMETSLTFAYLLLCNDTKLIDVFLSVRVFLFVARFVVCSFTSYQCYPGGT